MSDLVPQWMIDIETDKMRRMGREAYIADAFQRMREMALKQDKRNAVLRGGRQASDKAKSAVRESLEKIAPGYAPADDVPF